ncbi:hypothetical protein EMWEY_00035250 [Eimeria maxima]|uniref:Uncharacterized protein n=1 Tax=Eimeria maxima TaxID=5804 RepID=U6M9X3_EIMMA|nr:hypothetical protein EMWEY_00035250 [Eimeria maxima]CDJ60831.1 hypothetical protein EMWEY_00035250 [Eimeria maxima]
MFQARKQEQMLLLLQEIREMVKEGCSLLDATRPVSAEEANLLGKWDQRYKDTQTELNVLQQEVQTMDLPIAMKPIVEEAAATEQQVLEVDQSGPSGILALLGVPTEDKPVLKEHCKAVWERNAEVKILLLLNRMGAYTENAKKTASGMIAGSKILQPDDHQRAGELKKHVEHAVTTTRRTDNLSADVNAVGEYVCASEKLSHLVLMQKLDGLLQNGPEAAAEVYATEEKKAAGAHDEKEGDLEQKDDGAPMETGDSVAI